MVTHVYPYCPTGITASRQLFALDRGEADNYWPRLSGVPVCGAALARECLGPGPA